MLVTRQAACTRIESPEVNGIRLYVPNTKAVTFVDISNVSLDCDAFGAYDLTPDEYNGNVKQRLDMSFSPAEVLANFELICEHIKGLAKVEVKKGRGAKKAPDSVVKVSIEEVEAALAKRRELIAKVAAEKGVGISPATEVELSTSAE
jgi:hypothetical protein